MARRTAKGPTKVASPPTTRAFDHGEKAAGMARLKPGFGFTPQDDMAFALGFPYLKFLVDDERDPRAEAERLVIDGYPYQHFSYGREAAVRLVRALYLPRAYDIGSEGTPVLRPEAIEALDRSDPITPEEARASLFAMVVEHPPPFAEMPYCMMEALMGPDLVTSVIVEALEHVPVARWISHPRFEQAAIDTLCLMSLRLLPADREQLLGRLRELGARVLGEARRGFDIEAAKRDLAVPIDRVLPASYAADPEAYKKELFRRRALQEHIDLVEQDAMNGGFDVVHGREIVRPPRPIVQAAPDVVGAVRLADAARGWYTIPDPRVVFLGGDEVYRVELGLWQTYTHPMPPGEAQRLILERFGRIRSPDGRSGPRASRAPRRAA